MRTSLKELRRLQKNLGLKYLTPSRKAGRSTGRGSLRSASGLEEEFARQLRAEGITGWTREYKFHPERKWRLDVAFIDQSIGVELHGGTFSNGRHTRGTGYAEDRFKVNEAQILGWLILECTAEQVKAGQAIDWLKQALAVSEGIYSKKRQDIATTLTG